MGFGFRCGFLGLLHMEIVQERLEREYDLDLIITAPTVVYRAMLTSGEEVIVDNPCLLPDAAKRDYISEPYVRSATAISLCLHFLPCVSLYVPYTAPGQLNQEVGVTVHLIPDEDPGCYHCLFFRSLQSKLQSPHCIAC